MRGISIRCWCIDINTAEPSYLWQQYHTYPRYMYVVQLEDKWKTLTPEGWLNSTNVVITYRSREQEQRRLYMDTPIGGYMREISILEFLITTGANPLTAFVEKS